MYVLHQRKFSRGQMLPQIGLTTLSIEPNELHLAWMHWCSTGSATYRSKVNINADYYYLLLS